LQLYFQNLATKAKPFFLSAKKGYRYASLAWTLFRLINGNLFFAVLWQLAKLVWRETKPFRPRRFKKAHLFPPTK
jgi:hypothetical protein